MDALLQCRTGYTWAVLARAPAPTAAPIVNRVGKVGLACGFTATLNLILVVRLSLRLALGRVLHVRQLFDTLCRVQWSPFL